MTQPPQTPPTLERRAARVAAIHSEIRALGEASLQPQLRPLLTWTESVFGDTGPFAIVKRKAGRFRLPRAFKTELIDRVVEADALPTTQLTTLIVVAHPDDESIGAGARLNRLGNAWIVEITNGAPHDLECARRHGFDTPEEYAEARRRELDQAMSIAAFPLQRLISLGYIDGEVTLRLAEVCLRVTELIDSLKPDVVLTHPYEGGHTDHDATAFAVHLACGVLRREGLTPPAILELALYHAQSGRKVVQQFLPHAGADKDQRIVRLNAAERAKKKRIFGAFETQKSVLDHFSLEFERFRPAPRYIFTAPPHAGQLNYERYGDPDRGKSWREHAERVLRGLGMRRD
ncbi:MAG: PIG-L deacetylase family protein [Gemmatimonadaceae bacterium]